MTRTAPRVVLTRRLPEPVETRLAALFDLRVREHDAPMSHDELLAAATDTTVLAPTLTDTISADVIEAGAAAGLKLIANYGTGVEHIDLDAAHHAGVTVTNTPGVLSEDTADMTMALILASLRRLTEGERLVRAGAFKGWSPTWMLGRALGGSKLGIVGMGRIGQAVARRARACGMEIHYHNRAPVSPAIAEALEATYWESCGQMLANIDVVTVHCPSSPNTYHLLSERRLRLLQPHAFLINTARGNVIDEQALGALIEEQAIAGAALDVFEHEPEVDPRLLRADNVILMPHMSSSTLEARIAMGERVAINIRVWQSGERPPDRVLPDDLVMNLR